MGLLQPWSLAAAVVQNSEREGGGIISLSISAYRDRWVYYGVDVACDFWTTEIKQLSLFNILIKSLLLVSQPSGPFVLQFYDFYYLQVNQIRFALHDPTNNISILIKEFC